TPASPSSTGLDGEPEIVAVEQIRTFELEDAGLVDPTGLSASPSGDALFVVDGADLDTIAHVATTEWRIGTLDLGLPLASPAAFAYDPGHGEVIAVGAGASTLERVSELASGRSTADRSTTALSPDLGDLLENGFAVDGVRGAAYALDDQELVILDYEAASGTVGGPRSRLDLGDVLAGSPAGVSVAHTTGSLYVGDPDGDRVLVVGPGGELEQILDLSPAGITDLVDVAVAPSDDPNDGVDVLSLYAINGRGDGSSRLVELSTSAPPVRAVAFAADVATLIQSFAGSSLIPKSPDSSGLTYMPSNAHVLMADSEVNEYGYYTGVNLWELTTSGVVVNTGTTADPPGSSTDRWSDEPSGITFDEPNNRVFTTDDTPLPPGAIYEVDIGADGIVGTADDVEIQKLDASDYGVHDPEGISYDTTRGWLYVAAGTGGVVRIDPGANGTFDGGGDDSTLLIDVKTTGNVSDAEGVAYNAATDTITVIDYRDSTIAEFSVGGTFIREIDISAGGLSHPAGATWAPSSLGSGQSLWVVDRAIDGSSPVDGKLVELSIPGSGPTVPDIAVTPDPLAFGSVGVGVPADIDVLVANTGTATLSVSDVSVTAGGAEFSVVAGGGAFTVAPGGSHAVTVRFDPSSQTSFAGNLRISSDDPDEDPVDVALTGDGVLAVPEIVVSPLPALGFGSAGVGSPVDMMVTVSNVGTATLSVSDVSVTAGGAEFSVLAGGGAFGVAPGAGHDVTVRFVPGSAGSFAGNLRISSDDADESVVDVALTGDGVLAVPEIVVSPLPALGFGSAG
ncbi:MAG: choice-of-anchor D domain-containing protein, partial [Acidimicrobiales bacterium]